MIKILNHLRIFSRPDFRLGALHPSFVRLRDASGLALAGSISLCSLRSSYSVEFWKIFKKSLHGQAKSILAFSPPRRSPDQLNLRHPEMGNKSHSVLKDLYQAIPAVKVPYQGGLLWQIPTEASDSLSPAILHRNRIP
jgi:hypothetical protein